jgi:AAA+ superfamily predicted ATPase
MMRYQKIRGGSRFVVDSLVSGSSLVWENRGMRMIAKQNLSHSPALLDCATCILRSLSSCKKCITLDLGG